MTSTSPLEMGTVSAAHETAMFTIPLRHASTTDPDDGEHSYRPFESIPTPGYPRLAGLMGHHGSAAIFRRFGALNALNLMALQAELLDLEEELKDILIINESRQPVLLQDFFEMRNREEGSAQKEVMKKIRGKLAEYNKTLIDVSQVASLSRPHKADLHTLRRWLKGSKPDEGNSFLRGIEREAWHQRYDLGEFLLVDAVRAEADATTARLVDKLLQWFNHFIGYRYRKPSNSGVVAYSGLKTTAKYIVTLVSSMLPAISILGLYFEDDLLKRIGIMISMTFVFAAALVFCTSARRIEVFSATAAFAAVEVVFIGSTDNRNSTKS